MTSSSLSSQPAAAERRSHDPGTEDRLSPPAVPDAGLFRSPAASCGTIQTGNKLFDAANAEIGKALKLLSAGLDATPPLSGDQVEARLTIIQDMINMRDKL